MRKEENSFVFSVFRYMREYEWEYVKLVPLKLLFGKYLKNC